MRIDAGLVQQIRDHGAREAPIEACGYLAGNGDSVTMLFPMRNVDESPEHFSFDPREQFAVVKQARTQGVVLLGTYHTHPESPARMSEEDKRLAADPAARYVILSFLDQQIRCFRVSGDTFVEESIEISDHSRFYDLPDSLESEISSYAAMVNDFQAGRVDVVRMKTTRVPMGVYEQREDGSYMTRIRVAGGDITPTQLVGLVDLAGTYTGGPLHITTRQDIQVHDLRLEDTPKLMKQLIPLGLSTRGGGGNTVRNISASWDSGFAPGEAFDVAPHARALTSRMIAEPDSWTLPRKFKIAFSSTAEDKAYATVTDVGFIARLDSEGNRGFRVYAGGGMGTRPTLGILLYDFVPEADVYAVATAGKRLFDAYGNRKDRNAARLRFLLLKWGEEKFRAEYDEMLATVRAENPAPLELRQTAKLQPGYVEVPVFLGDLSYTAAREIARVAAPFGNESLRLTPRQNLVIKNIPLEQVSQVRRQLVEAGVLSDTQRIEDNAVSCAGASTCRLGICLSRDLVRAVAAEAETAVQGAGKAAGLLINVSGCPNSCGQHLLGDLGFFGGAVRRNGQQLPAYNVVLGGRAGDGNAHLAETVGRVPARNVPNFVRDVVELINTTRYDGESYHDYFTRERAAVVALVEKHSEVATPEENPDAYMDWGATSSFSVLRKQGECATGVVDLIRRDFEQAEEALKRHADSQSHLHLQQAVEAASNALLITRGVEARTSREAVELFLTHFGDSVGESRAVAEAYLAGSALAPQQVQEFVEAAKQAYDAMDSTLGHQAASKAVAPVAAPVVARERDLRGVQCPLNFVKTKLILEELEHGQILKVLLDDGPPIENVPASVAAEGHEVLELTRSDDHWQVLIRKNAA